MKCAKCGAELKTGCVYCSVCGAEVQVVSDDSILEDDYLKALMTEDTSEEKKKITESKPSIEKKKPNKKIFIIIGAIVVALAVFFVSLFIIIKGNSYESQLKKAQTAYDKKNYEEALEYVKKALKRNEKGTEAMILSAKAHLGLEKEENAISDLKDVISIDKTNETAYKMLIDIYAQKEDYDTLAKLYEDTSNKKIQKLFADYIVTAPSFSKKAGIYDEAIEIILDAEDELNVYYTTDGTNPKEYGTKYVSAIPFSENGEYVLRAVCEDERGIYSKVVKAVYEVEISIPDLPTASPASGTYTEPIQISIDVPDNCSAYYEWNGTPGSNSQVYQEPFDMIEGNNVLSIILVNQNGQTSGIQKYNYIYMP